MMPDRSSLPHLIQPAGTIHYAPLGSPVHLPGFASGEGVSHQAGLPRFRGYQNCPSRIKRKTETRLLETAHLTGNFFRVSFMRMVEKEGDRGKMDNFLTMGEQRGAHRNIDYLFIILKGEIG